MKKFIFCVCILFSQKFIWASNPFYDQQTEISQSFLRTGKYPNTKEVVYDKFNAFKEAYEATQEPFTPQPIIDITGLSSRMRIALLRLIINEKLTHLPGNAFDQQQLHTIHWRKLSIREINNVKNTYDFVKRSAVFKSMIGEPYGNTYEVYDLLPTVFQIGTFQYTLRLGACKNQRGSGKISGFFNDEKSGSYEEIISRLNGIRKVYGKYRVEGGSLCTKTIRDTFPGHLLQQKKDGQPICIGQDYRHVEQFLNGFNFLLDYEVARRLVDDPRHDHADPFYTMPVVFGVKKLIQSFSNIKEFNALFLMKPSGDFYQFLLQKNLVDPKLTFTFLGGDNRAHHLESHIASSKQSIENPRRYFRKKLDYLHSDSEISTSDDEEKDKVDHETSTDETETTLKKSHSLKKKTITHKKEGLSRKKRVSKKDDSSRKRPYKKRG